MPWSKPMNQEEQRFHLISDWLNGSFSMVDLAIRFGISRKTLYKWKNRFFDKGIAGLSDRSRLPKSCPHKTPIEIVVSILQIRKRRPSFGAKKILPDLAKHWPTSELPSLATINSILSKNGLVKSPRKRRNPGHPGAPLSTHMQAPNATWCADFKGQFKLKNGAYCYPLTITD